MSFLRRFVLLASSLTSSSLLHAGAIQAISNSPIDFHFGNKRLAHWGGNGFIVVDDLEKNVPVIHVFSSDGREISSWPFSMPGARLTRVIGYSYSQDGRVARGGFAVANDGGVGRYVALVGSNGAVETVVSTGTFTPQCVVFAPDGTLWAQGFHSTPDGMVFFHFDRDGGIIGSAVPQSTIAHGANRIALSSSDNQIIAMRDKVAWFCPREGRYIEISNSGAITGLTTRAFPAGDKEKVSGIAATPSGETIISTEVRRLSEPSTNFYTLNAQRHAWTLLSDATGFDGVKYLMGNHGNLIVGLCRGSSLAFFQVSE